MSRYIPRVNSDNDILVGVISGGILGYLIGGMNGFFLGALAGFFAILRSKSTE